MPWPCLPGMTPEALVRVWGLQLAGHQITAPVNNKKHPAALTLIINHRSHISSTHPQHQPQQQGSIPQHPPTPSTTAATAAATAVPTWVKLEGQPRRHFRRHLPGGLPAATVVVVLATVLQQGGNKKTRAAANRSADVNQPPSMLNWGSRAGHQLRACSATARSCTALKTLWQQYPVGRGGGPPPSAC